MSDARWLDVADDVSDAALHFTNAQSLHATGRYEALGIEGYRDGMALMHALQAGHTSAEAAMLRILRILGEDAPTGEDWHRTPGRPFCRPRLPPTSTRRAASAIERCGIMAGSTRAASGRPWRRRIA